MEEKQDAQNPTCGCGRKPEHGEEHPDKFAMMMCMGKAAKMELLKEKLKKRIDATQGKRLDQVADIIAEMMAEKYKAKAAVKRKKKELRQKLEDIMMEE
jgi:hypothetical protein